VATPLSCARCQKPIAVDSASGLCATCFNAFETEQSADIGGPTGSFVAGGSTRLWAGKARAESQEFEVAPSTREWEGPLRYRNAPAGFEFVRYLGGGGMGDVYLARELVADRLVAVKFLRAAADPHSVKRFEKEIRALARLDHPNIVRVFTVSMDRADPFFTMEYAQGGSLSDRIKREGPMAPAEAAQLAVKLIGALKASHAEQILHRDIKPANILFDSNGTPKLGDFGLAKTLDDGTDTNTIASRAVGTPPFMPPEAVSRRHGGFSPATDVYGLGATLFHSLTGRPPYTGEPHEVMRQVERDPPPRPCSIRPEVPLELEAVVLKCLEKKPEDRYNSADDLAGDLEKYLSDRGGEISAKPLTRARRAKLWLKRRAVWIAAAVVLVAAATAIVLSQPVDPWEKARRDLKTGRPVTLIGETGNPKKHVWRIGAPEFGRAPYNDGTCTFESVGVAMLELLDDPGVERYRIRAELRQNQATGLAPGAQPRSTENTIGLYFSYAETPSATFQVHTFFSVRFNDYDRHNKPPQEQPVRLEHNYLLQAPNLDAFPNPAMFGNHMFLPSAVRPGPWRIIEVDVSADQIAARWVDGDKSYPLPTAASATSGAKYQQIQKDLAQMNPGIQIPEWRARMPLGIYAEAASVSVRNVTITPLDPPDL
jgi:serine/threonine-protein kinase